MLKTQPPNLAFEQVFNQINPEIKKTFDKEQIKAIKRTFDSQDWSNHSLDLRISFPISKLKFYLVLLGGTERRSKQRLQYERSLHPLWTPINSIFLLVALIILSASSFAIFSYALSSIDLTFLSSPDNPTSIPWIDNESECQYTSRTWRDGKCWDYEHSSMF